MLFREFRKRFIGPLHNALGTNINPTTRSHLSVHHEAFFIELVETSPNWHTPERDSSLRSILSVRLYVI